MDEVIPVLDMNTWLDASQSFEVFVTKILGLEFASHHKEISNIYANSKLGLIVVARGHGKSELLVAYALWYACFNHNKSMMIISSSLMQSFSVLERIKTYIDENPYLKFLRPKYVFGLNWDEWKMTWSKQEINVSTSCKIMCRPFSPSIRGNHVDLALLDDILRDSDNKMNAMQVKKLFVEVIRPIVNTKNGRLIIDGTPQEEDDLLWVIKNDMDEYDCIEIPACDVGDNGELLNAIWDTRFSIGPDEGKTDLISLRKEMNAISPFSFEKEYLLQPISGNMSIFNADVIKRQTIDIPLIMNKRDNCYYYCGVDVAMSENDKSDYTVITIIEEDPDAVIRVIKTDRFSGVGSTGILNRIQYWHKRFDFVKIMIEQVGLSYGMIRQANEDQMFDTESNIIRGLVEGFKTSNQNKDSLIGQLNLGLDIGELFIPDDDLLVKEMLSFSVVLSRNKKVLKGVGAHDDMVMSLALAYECFKQFNSCKVDVFYL